MCVCACVCVLGGGGGGKPENTRASVPLARHKLLLMLLFNAFNFLLVGSLIYLLTSCLFVC